MSAPVSASGLALSVDVSSVTPRPPRVQPGEEEENRDKRKVSEGTIVWHMYTLLLLGVESKDDSYTYSAHFFCGNTVYVK